MVVSIYKDINLLSVLDKTKITSTKQLFKMMDNETYKSLWCRVDKFRTEKVLDKFKLTEYGKLYLEWLMVKEDCLSRFVKIRKKMNFKQDGLVRIPLEIIKLEEKQSEI